MKVAFHKHRWFSTSTSTPSSSSLPWISPLLFLKATSQEPDLPTETTTTVVEARRKSKFISHDSAINLIKRERDPQRALEIFNKASDQRGFNHNNATYATILDKLAQFKKFQAIDAILHQMTYETCRFHEGIFLNLMKHYSKSSLHERVLEMFYAIQTIVREKPSLNLITYSTLMDGLCECGRLKEAVDVFEDMVSKDHIVPDALTYNVLINGFSRGGKVDRAKIIIEFMKKNGCKPNIFNYSALMKGFCKEGRLEEAIEAFIEMKSIGLKPDSVVYTTLIDSFCKTERTNEAMDLLQEMKEKGCRADVVTFNVILGGLCREGRVEKALGMLYKLPYEGFSLNKASYRIVLNFLCKEGDLGKALELLCLMLGRGFLPHFATSNELLVRLCEEGKVADAATLLLGLVEMGFKPEPDSWNILVDVICRERKLLPAFVLLDDLVTKES